MDSALLRWTCTTSLYLESCRFVQCLLQSVLQCTMIFLIQTALYMFFFFFLFLQSMVEMVAENYHNIWAKKKKTELISKGVVENCALVCSDQPLFRLR